MVEVDEIIVHSDPVTCRVGRFSSEMALAPRLQMRPSDATDGVLTVPQKALDIRLDSCVHVVALWTVAHYYNFNCTVRTKLFTEGTRIFANWRRLSGEP